MTITVHDLKTWPEFYDDIDSGRKSIEIRRDDRGYKTGDVLKLREWNPKTGEYTGRVTHKEILYILRFTDLSTEIRDVLGLNPSFAPINGLAILSLNFLSAWAASELTRQAMTARPLNLSAFGEPELQADPGHDLAAHIYELKMHGEIRPALLRVYLILSNQFHTMWTQWVCSLVHLRNVDGAEPVKKDYPHAEYEIVVQAVDPMTPILSCQEPLESIRFLCPIDSRVQFNGINDGQATTVQQLMMQLIANGQISPDSDYRLRWVQRVRALVQDLRYAH